jgi:hypothetical protein
VIIFSIAVIVALLVLAGLAVIALARCADAHEQLDPLDFDEA